LTYAAADGSNERIDPITVEVGRAAAVEAGVVSLVTGRFVTPTGITSVELSAVALGDYFAAIAAGSKVPWTRATKGALSKRGTFVADIDSKGFARGAYVTRAVFTDRSGAEREALAMIEVR